MDGEGGGQRTGFSHGHVSTPTPRLPSLLGGGPAGFCGEEPSDTESDIGAFLMLDYLIWFLFFFRGKG